MGCSHKHLLQCASSVGGRRAAGYVKAYASLLLSLRVHSTTASSSGHLSRWMGQSPSKYRGKSDSKSAVGGGRTSGLESSRKLGVVCSMNARLLTFNIIEN